MKGGRGCEERERDCEGNEEGRWREGGEVGGRAWIRYRSVERE